MKLIPVPFYNSSGSRAEKKIADHLKRIDFGPSAVAIHSQNISEHWHKEGVDLFWSLRCVARSKRRTSRKNDDGIFFLPTAMEKKTEKEKALSNRPGPKYALKKALEKQLGKHTLEEVAFGWAGVFPDIDFPAVKGFLTIIDGGCCIDQRQLKAALENLPNIGSAKRYYSDLTSEKYGRSQGF